MSTPFEKIKFYFDEKQATEQREKYEKETEKQIVKLNPVRYVTNYLSGVETVLTEAEIYNAITELETEAQLQISATATSRFTSEFAAKNYNEGLTNLVNANESRLLLEKASQKDS